MNARSLIAPSSRVLRVLRTLLHVMLVAISSLAAAASGSSPTLDSYPGQESPGDVPKIFAPGIVSTDEKEASSVFSPDGSTFFFARFDPSIGYRIMLMERVEDGWTAPRVAPFSGRYSEVDPFITTSGKQLYFISKRPSTPGGERSSVYRVWVLDHGDDGWTAARVLGPNVNSGSRQLYPTLSSNGRLYFGSNRPGGMGGSDLYVAAPSGEEFSAPENLGGAINSEHDETDALIAPDESFIVFTSVDRADGFGNGDLYVSFRTEDGNWSEAENMGAAINTSASEFCPMLSPDGAYLFFTSGRSGNDDIYWVNASVIERLKPVNRSQP